LVIIVILIFAAMLYWAFRRSKRKVASLKEEVVPAPAGK
jgi:cbb3-type cytochrome oxidase subunit 3